VRVGRAKAREHLPSYREPASRNPQAARARTFYRERSSAHRFAFSRLVPRVSGASSFPPASVLFFPPHALADIRWTRRAMRSTDFCHLNDRRAPVLRAFPARYAAFTAWTPPSFEVPACASHEVLGFVRTDRGTECFTALVNASADRSETRAACFASALTHRERWWELERGRFLPTAPAADQASDTSVASPSRVERRSGLRPPLDTRALSSCLRRHSAVRKPPRSPCTIDS
jgi:hypothetical protein